ncbi:MAG: hypothetical protein ACK4Z5_02740 [Brevundimonas sp.]
MAQGSFSAQISQWVKETKDRELAVRNKATERIIEIMQEPGPSMATVAMAVATGQGLGKVKADGSRGVSRRAFGPIANPGGSGNLPVDTGFLRASLVVGRGTLNVPTTTPPENGPQSYSWDPGDVTFAISGASISDPIEARYTAAYARVAEYGGKNRKARRFVALAAQQWQGVVTQTANELKAQAGA